MPEKRPQNTPVIKRAEIRASNDMIYLEAMLTEADVTTSNSIAIKALFLHKSI